MRQHILKPLAVTLLTSAVAASFPATGNDPLGTSAKELGLTELTDDLSRQELFAYVRKAYEASNPKGAEEAAQYFNLNGPFTFPTDVDYDKALKKPRYQSLFGIDISHYTSTKFPIKDLPQKKVKFLYMKATQGTGSLDAKFAGFWSRAKNVKVHRGAYHFLSSTDPNVAKEHWDDKEAADWGKAQATTFVKVIKANGGLLPTDMPPVVDLEWDRAKDGPDRWRNRSASQIVTMVRAFLSEVKLQLNRTPMIYTAKSWWNERMESEKQFATLANYPLWLADYSKNSRASEMPKTINDIPWALWQYTDGATMEMGFNGKFDASIFKGKAKSFYEELGISEFGP